MLHNDKDHFLYPHAVVFTSINTVNKLRHKGIGILPLLQEKRTEKDINQYMDTLLP